MSLQQLNQLASCKQPLPLHAHIAVNDLCNSNKSSTADQLALSVSGCACFACLQMPLAVSLMLSVYGHTVALVL